MTEGTKGSELKRRINPFARSDNCWIPEDKNKSPWYADRSEDYKFIRMPVVTTKDYSPLIPRVESALWGYYVPSARRISSNKNQRNLFIATNRSKKKKKEKQKPWNISAVSKYSHGPLRDSLFFYEQEKNSLDSSKDRHVNPIPLEADASCERKCRNKMHVLRIL